MEAPIFASLVNGFDYIEADNRKILNYGWVNFPLAYVQVATLSVYAYLLSSLLGKVILIYEVDVGTWDEYMIKIFFL